VLSIFLVTYASPAQAAEIQTLPGPETSGGMGLMETLAQRMSTRTFSNNPISDQMLSNLLWATWGINREDGRRTAPTASNSQNIDVYVVLASGIWRYEGTSHYLEKVVDGDHSARVGGTPITLLYVAPQDDRYAAMHVGSLYQNAGLFCASVGLGNVVKASGVNALDNILILPAGQRIFIVHSIGWPR